MDREITLIGCGGHSRVVASVIIKNKNFNRIIFEDKNAKKDEKILGFKVLKNYKKKTKTHIAIGDNTERALHLRKQSEIVSVISKFSITEEEVEIGKGCFIGNGAVLGACVSVGKGTIVNTNAVIEHQSVIGDFNHISVGTVVCGKVTTGSNVTLGPNCTVLDEISICDNVIVGAGSTVIKNITESGVYVGSPIRKIRENK
ncbi:MAG: hypothetical protein B6I23_01430 [Rickettsiaceae bacterium 4572_127]|nr:MAG: hypothetical protein B6I23_01430 [Rickettsiaceae bacterium 4572_127]